MQFNMKSDKVLVIGLGFDRYAYYICNQAMTDNGYNGLYQQNRAIDGKLK